MSKSMVKLVYSGPGQQINSDVAAATGDGRLVDGREIEVEKDLAELLQRSSPYWAPKRSSKSKSKSKSKGKGKKQAPVVVDDAPAAAESADGASESQED